MTKQEMLSEVEAKIRKDIPRLMELSEGCWIKQKTLEKDFIFKVIAVKNDFFKCVLGFADFIFLAKDIVNSPKSFEIIGHDIMLNDVLEWLNYIIYEKCIPINDLGYSGMVKQFYVKGDDGSIIFEILDLKNPDLGLDIIRYGVWDLSSIYLKDQSERVIKFLYKIKNE
ncbi:hypothetical protein ACI75Y_03010 [Capnocytophaga stomatis]|uniref:hypothetical protein n=1 Tax=Capnocytophaga stomatis TaxID=1848904 RepID=UPI00385A56F5